MEVLSGIVLGFFVLFFPFCFGLSTLKVHQRKSGRFLGFHSYPHNQHSDTKETPHGQEAPLRLACSTLQKYHLIICTKTLMFGFSHQKQYRLLWWCSQAKTNWSTQSLTGGMSLLLTVSALEKPAPSSSKEGWFSQGSHKISFSRRSESGQAASKAGEKPVFVITSSCQGSWGFLSDFF